VQRREYQSGKAENNNIASGWPIGQTECGQHRAGNARFIIHLRASSKALASFRSAVSKPSVNQP
jgi:hypothetical protein